MSAKTKARRKQRAKARNKAAKAPTVRVATLSVSTQTFEPYDPRKPLPPIVLPPALPPLTGGGYDTA